MRQTAFLFLREKQPTNQQRFIYKCFCCNIAYFSQSTFLPNIHVEAKLSKDSCCSGDRRSCYTRCKVSLGFHVTIFSHYLNKNYIEVMQVPGNKDFPWCWQTLRPQTEVLTCRKRYCVMFFCFRIEIAVTKETSLYKNYYYIEKTFSSHYTWRFRFQRVLFSNVPKAFLSMQLLAWLTYWTHLGIASIIVSNSTLLFSNTQAW